MRGVRLPMAGVLLMLIVALPVRPCIADNEYQIINQGDWAVALVRGLGLDHERQTNKIEDFTMLLTGVGIGPKEGWQADYTLSFEDLAGTINQALLYLKSRKSNEIYSDYRDFLGFLENNAGVCMTALLHGLKNNQESDLRTFIADYLKSEAADEESGKLNPNGNNNNIKELDLLDALFIRESRKPDNYWKIFNRPSSPILPGKFY